MSDEMEKISITVADTRGSCTRIITDEYEVSDTCWPHLVEVFLEQLQGLGYGFVSTPEEMADVLEEYHQELIRAKCEACEVEEPAVEEKKYPYYGETHNAGGMGNFLVVKFTAPEEGEVVYSEGSCYKIGDIRSDWNEAGFNKVRNQ